MTRHTANVSPSAPRLPQAEDTTIYDTAMYFFKHRTLHLQHNEIRLLRIEKSADKNPPTKLTLRHVRLSNDLEYSAASYAWGAESPACQVSIHYEDGEEGLFPVSQNLYDFLLAARWSWDRWTAQWL